MGGVVKKIGKTVKKGLKAIGGVVKKAAPALMLAAAAAAVVYSGGAAAPALGAAAGGAGAGAASATAASVAPTVAAAAPSVAVSPVLGTAASGATTGGLLTGGGTALAGIAGKTVTPGIALGASAPIASTPLAAPLAISSGSAAGASLGATASPFSLAGNSAYTSAVASATGGVNAGNLSIASSNWGTVQPASIVSQSSAASGGLALPGETMGQTFGSAQQSLGATAWEKIKNAGASAMEWFEQHPVAGSAIVKSAGSMVQGYAAYQDAKAQREMEMEMFNKQVELYKQSLAVQAGEAHYDAGSGRVIYSSPAGGSADPVVGVSEAEPHKKRERFGTKLPGLIEQGMGGENSAARDTVASSMNTPSAVPAATFARRDPNVGGEGGKA